MQAAHLYWTNEHRKAAEEEGWNLFFRSDGFLEIEVSQEALENNPNLLFTTDDDVIYHCAKRAKDGSNLHLLALILDCRPINNQMYVPDEICLLN